MIRMEGPVDPFPKRHPVKAKPGTVSIPNIRIRSGLETTGRPDMKCEERDDFKRRGVRDSIFGRGGVRSNFILEIMAKPGPKRDAGACC